jgi:hypothetical protein
MRIAKLAFGFATVANRGMCGHTIMNIALVTLKQHMAK